MKSIDRGDIFLVNLDPAKGSEIKKTRPVIVVSNDLANMYSRVLMVVPLTSQKQERILPHELFIGKPRGLAKESKAIVEQMRAIDKGRLVTKLTKLSPELMSQLSERMKIHLGLE